VSVLISIILVITSVLMVMLILLHRGKGGGLSDLFGGGVSSTLSGSSIVEKNLDRITIFTGIVWFAAVVAEGLVLKHGI
jgi:preprotein translocase subunit SecG